MYAFPEMISLGLLENQEWPSEAHKKVAQFIGLGNGRVDSQDKLIEVCQTVIAIPMDKIKIVDIVDCATNYDVPYISLS